MVVEKQKIDYGFEADQHGAAKMGTPAGGYKLLAGVIEGVEFKDSERVDTDLSPGITELAVHQI